MKSGAWLRRAVVVGSAAAMVMLGAAVSRADDAGGGTGRAVRLSSVDGQVQVAQGGEVLADHALANTPLFEGTQISTGDDGRAEIQFEDGSVTRIAPESSLTLTVLRAGETEMELESGMGYFELQDGNAANPMRVRFGGSVVTVSGFTVLRVKLDEGPGELAVFSGNAHMDATNGASVDIRGGESVSLNNLNLSEAIEPDSWDAWNSDRDQAMTTADVGQTQATNEAPNSANPAWNDLNSNGTWYNVPDQGYVWSPYDAESAGWDPYNNGYWMWNPGYGYVWVSGYAWGYMPYQCGMWNWYDSFGWGWAPGVCNTWWGGGGWFFNVGFMPVWYRLPVRPHPSPIGLRPEPPVRIAGGGRIVKQPLGLRPVAPVITVKRTEPVGPGGLPPRVVGHPILIGSVVAQPLMPTTPRNTVSRRVTSMPTPGRPGVGVNPGYGARLEPGVTVGSTGRQTYTLAPVTGGPRQGYVPVQRPGYQPMPSPGSGRTPVPVGPAPRMTTPAPVYRPAPAPRPSGGGSAPRAAPAGGGGSHVSGGAHK